MTTKSKLENFVSASTKTVPERRKTVQRSRQLGFEWPLESDSATAASRASQLDR